MTDRSLKSKLARYACFGVSVFLFVAAISIISERNGSVSADTNTPLSSNGPQPGSSDVIGAGGSQTPFYAVGTGAFDGKYSWVKVYVPNGQRTTISINQACSLDVGSPSVRYEMQDLASGAGASTETYMSGFFGGPYLKVLPDTGGCSSTITFPEIHTSDGVASEIKGHEGYRAFYLIATIDGDPGDNERSFRVNSSNPNVLIGATRPIQDSGKPDIATKFFGIYQRDAPSKGGEMWNYEIEVAPTCNELSSPASKTVTLYDSDKGVYSPQNLSMVIERSPRGTNSWSTYKTWGSSSFGGNHATDYFDFNASNDYIYKIHVNGINWHNTIQIKLPFDQFDASRAATGVNDKCNSPPTADLTLDCPAGTFTISNERDSDHPGSNDSYRLLHGGTVDKTGNVRGGVTVSMSIVVSRVYTLQIRDDDGTWVTVDSQSVSRCGTTRPVPDCETYNKSIGAHSIYRFTVFPKIQSYSPTTPADHDHWATFTNPSAPAYGQAAQWSTTNSTDDNVPFTHDMPDPTGPDRYIYLERWTHEGDGSWTYTSGNQQIANCYSANCTLDVDETVAGTTNGVRAGSDYTIRATITNTGIGNLPESFGSRHLGLTGAAGSSYAVNGVLATAGSGIDAGQTQEFTFTKRASATPTTYTIKGYPDYNGLVALGGNCNSDAAITVDVYAPFSVSVSAATTFTGGAENPTSIDYVTKVSNASGPTVDVPTTSSFTKNGTGLVPNGGGGTYAKDNPDPTTAFSGNYVVISRSAGDNYCTTIDTTYTHGYVGPGGSSDVKETGDPGHADDCDKVYNAPYVHFFGSDVSAGGGFEGGTCNNPGGIKTYFNNTAVGVGTGPSGSGVQIGALSINPIFGFKSALSRTTNPSTPPSSVPALSSTSFSFSNTTNVPGANTGNAGGTGGSMNNTHCIADYFASMPTGTATSTAADATADVAAGGTKFYTPVNATHTLTIDTANVPVHKNTVMYVDGNVHITGTGIRYDNSSGPADMYGVIEDVPSFTLIVRGGTITIDGSVTRLDGVFVSQPSTAGAGGSIYTCDTVDAPSLITNCSNQLLVNGSFVAKKVFLLRSFGSLRDATFGEYFTRGVNKNCSGSGAAPVTTGRNDCAAEIFNFTPEIYLSQPNLIPVTGPTKGTYDYITSLAPVL